MLTIVSSRCDASRSAPMLLGQSSCWYVNSENMEAKVPAILPLLNPKIAGGKQFMVEIQSMNLIAFNVQLKGSC